MSRSDDQRFTDILDAVERCLAYRDHLSSSDELIASMAYDAILRNLAVIGEAVRNLPLGTTDSMHDVPWKSIAGLRNVVIHEYFRIDPDLVIDIVDHQLVDLAEQLRRQR